MKVQILVAAVSIVSLSWLGMSFATPSEPPVESGVASLIGQTVSAEHPDSHRLGEVITEGVALPAWDEDGLGGELALIVE